ncbi:hypothetical protein SprV_1002888600 [Sparganum proliferum]
MCLFGHNRVQENPRKTTASGNIPSQPQAPESAVCPVEVDNLPNAAALTAAGEAVDVAAETASVEDRWCQLRDTIQLTALHVLGRARRQHQDWFDENDAAISNLLAKRNNLHKAYLDHSNADNKAAFYRSRR